MIINVICSKFPLHCAVGYFPASRIPSCGKLSVWVQQFGICIWTGTFSYSCYNIIIFHTISADSIDVRFVCGINFIQLDWEWEDIYHVGSSQCLIGREPFRQQTRANASSISATFCPHKWGDFLFYLCQTRGSLYEHWTLCNINYHITSQEQIKHADKQLKYQCRCSFLEVEQYCNWY